MATHTLTQVAPFTCVAYSQAYGVLSDADLATISQAIKDDLNPAHPTYPNPSGGFVREGELYVPRRGFLKVLPGDVVAVDQNGMPILVPAYTLTAGGAWVFA